jgi:hypothetical protein
MFFKQTSHPKRKNRYSSGRATTTSKTKQNRIKQTKSSNCNEIPTRESKTVSNKLQLQTKSTTLRKGNSTVLVRTQRETRERKREAERRRARQQAREPREMRERERTRRRLREREGRARTQLVKLRETELKAARNRKRAWSRTTTPLQSRLPTLLLFYSFVWLRLLEALSKNDASFHTVVPVLWCRSTLASQLSWTQLFHFEDIFHFNKIIYILKYSINILSFLQVKTKILDFFFKFIYIYIIYLFIYFWEFQLFWK